MCPIPCVALSPLKRQTAIRRVCLRAFCAHLASHFSSVWKGSLQRFIKRQFGGGNARGETVWVLGDWSGTCGGAGGGQRCCC